MEIKLCVDCKKIFIEEKKCSICGNSLTLKDENFLIGKELGKYKIEEFIGEGGMGAVFKGVHSTLKKPVAIKILTPSKIESSLLKRFKKEAEVMALLKHPNIVEIYDYDISPWGFPYIVMEYLEGWSLRTEINKHQNGLPLIVFKNFIKQIISGLSFAHKKGIVHRDLKPENIFISTIGEQRIVKILDFGIAKVLFSTDETQAITKTDTIIGTPQYLSPEQIMGNDITAKSDQYSLALIVLEMLTGKPAREGKTFGDIVSSISTKNVELEKLGFKQVNAEIAKALKKATNKDPSNRFGDLEEFEKYLIPEIEEFEEKPTIEITHKKQKRNYFKYLILLLFILLVASFYYIFSKNIFHEKKELFSLIGKYKIPSESVSFLTAKENCLYFLGINDLYLYSNSLLSEPVKVSLRENEEVIDGTEDGRIISLKNGKIYLKEYFISEKVEEKKELLIENLSKEGEIKFSNDLIHCAFINNNSLHLYKISNKKLKEIHKIDIRDKKLKDFKLGDKFLSYVLDDVLYIYNIGLGKEILNVSIDISNFYAMEFFEELGLFAIGGWFDGIYIYDLNDGRKKYSIVMAGITRSLKFIKDYPSLLIAKGDKIVIWKFKENNFLKFQEEGKDFVYSQITPFGLLAIERRENLIYLLAYKDFSFYKKYNLSKTQIWGIDYYDKNNLLFCGSSLGFLYSIDIQKSKKKEYQIHTQGITSIISLGNNLITASDDKTIAVWEIPEMRVSYRTEAHNWLINYLYFNKNTKNLWSSSSDGFLKILSFPGLKVLESIKTGDYSNAAIWVDEREEKIGVGTWDYRFLFFEKKNSNWEMMENYNIKTRAIYSMSYLPSHRVLFLCGVEPFNLYLYFIDEKKLFDIGFENSGIYWIDLFDESSIIAAGNNYVYLISIERKNMEISVKKLINTDLKICLVSKYIKERNLLAIGNEKGEIILINLNELKFPEGYTFKINREISY